MGIGFNPKNYDINNAHRIENANNGTAGANSANKDSKQRLRLENNQTNFQNSAMSFWGNKNFDKGQMKEILNNLPDGLSKFNYDDGKFSFYKEGNKLNLSAVK